MKVKDKYLKENLNEGWESQYRKETNKWVSKISKDIDYDIFAAAAIAYELLTDVNFHEAAAAIDRIVKMMKKE